MLFDLIEYPPFNLSHRETLTCGSTRVTQKLDPHSLSVLVLWLLEDDLECRRGRLVEVAGFFPLTTTSGIAIGVSVVGVGVGCDVSTGIVGRSERTDMICGWQHGGSRGREVGVYERR